MVYEDSVCLSICQYDVYEENIRLFFSKSVCEDGVYAHTVHNNYTHTADAVCLVLMRNITDVF